MISLHSKWSILASTKSPLVATQAFKHTAPDTDKFHRKKWSLDRSPYPRQPIPVKTPMVGLKQLLQYKYKPIQSAFCRLII